MIVSNKRSRWGSYAELSTTGFNCFVSTVPGLFKGSTLIIPTSPAGAVRQTPVAKAYLDRKLTKTERERAHDYILAGLDQYATDLRC